MIPDYLLLKQLIESPSVTPDDAGCKDILSHYFTQPYKDFSIKNTSNYYFETKGSGPLLLFLGHTDVVDAGDITHWQHPPFKLTQQNQTLYGRGLVDMKGAIWAFAHTLKHTQLNHIRLGLLLTSDEEGKGADGIKAIREHIRGLNPTWVLVGEPTSKSEVGDTYKTARRGSAHFHIKLIGQQGHTAYPHLAINPSSHLPVLLTSIEKLSAMFPNDDFSIYHIKTSSNIENVIPQYIEVSLNHRFCEMKNFESVQAHFSMYYQFQVSISAQPYRSKQHDLEAIIQATARNVADIKAQNCHYGGTSDARWLADICPNIIEYGLKNKTAHQVDEHCAIQDLLTLQSLYQSIVQKLESQSSSDKLIKKHITPIEQIESL